MYVLKHAGLLSTQLLQKRLAPFVYYPARHTHGLWMHKTRPIACSLIVEDFTVKYVGKQHAEHLGRKIILMYDFEMGLQKQDMRHFLAWICI
jgi:hypothetical protein